MQLEEFTFENSLHENNYEIYMASLPKNLRLSLHIQGAVYVIAFLEMKSEGAARYIFDYVRHSLSPGFFDNPDTERVAVALTGRLWEAVCCAWEDEGMMFSTAMATLDFLKFLNADLNKG